MEEAGRAVSHAPPEGGARQGSGHRSRRGRGYGERIGARAVVDRLADRSGVLLQDRIRWSSHEERDMRHGAALLISLVVGYPAYAADLPIFDAHLHYSHDAWETLPPKDAIAILRKAGLKRALISSSGDDGQQRLHTEAPDLVLRSLRPYRSRGDVGTWVRDETVPA